jgi:hypothetical protein
VFVVRKAEKGSHFLTLWLRVCGVGCSAREDAGMSKGRGREQERKRERWTATKVIYTKHLIDVEARERERGGGLERERE